MSTPPSHATTTYRILIVRQRDWCQPPEASLPRLPAKGRGAATSLLKEAFLQHVLTLIELRCSSSTTGQAATTATVAMAVAVIRLSRHQSRHLMVHKVELLPERQHDGRVTDTHQASKQEKKETRRDLNKSQKFLPTQPPPAHRNLPHTLPSSKQIAVKSLKSAAVTATLLRGSAEPLSKCHSCPQFARATYDATARSGHYVKTRPYLGTLL
jgi:hypothetical protein